jgi:hypothetical protein
MGPVAPAGSLEHVSCKYRTLLKETHEEPMVLFMTA